MKKRQKSEGGFHGLPGGLAGCDVDGDEDGGALGLARGFAQGPADALGDVVGAAARIGDQDAVGVGGVDAFAQHADAGEYGAVVAAGGAPWGVGGEVLELVEDLLASPGRLVAVQGVCPGVADAGAVGEHVGGLGQRGDEAAGGGDPAVEGQYPARVVLGHGHQQGRLHRGQT